MYKRQADQTEIVKNTAGATFTFTVKMPANITSYDVSNMGSGTGKTNNVSTQTAVSNDVYLTPYLNQTGLTADVTYTMSVGAAGTVPEVGLNYRNTVVTLTGEQPARSAIGAGVTSAYFTTPTSTTGTLNLTVVTSGNVATDGTNRIVVNYTENGVAKSVTKDTGLVGSGTETVTITVPSIAEDTTIVVTGVKVQSQIKYADLTSLVLTNSTSDELTVAIDNVKASDTWVDVGTKLQVKVTAKADDITNTSGEDGIVVSMNGVDKPITVADTTGKAYTVTFDYTVIVGANDLTSGTYQITAADAT